MSTLPWRRLLTVVAALGMMGLAGLPPEHAHGGRGEAGHSEVVHRHFEAHHSHAQAPRPRHLTVIDDDDDDDAAVRWRETSFTRPTPRQFLQSTIRPAGDFVVFRAPAPLSSQTIRTVHFVSVHDPPWAAPSGLRGPPLSV